MTTSALILIVSVWTIVTCVTGFFFYKVLTTKPNAEPDSYDDNDGVVDRK